MGGNVMILSQVFASNYAWVVDGVPTDKDVHRTRHPEHGRTPGGYAWGSVSWLEATPRWILRL